MGSRTGRRGKEGFTLLEIMLVVAIIGLLAVIAIPAVNKARLKSIQNTCINNLRLINDAKVMYGFEKKYYKGIEPTEGDLAPYFQARGSKGKGYAKGQGKGKGKGSEETYYFLACPAGGLYVINPLELVPECSLKDDEWFPHKIKD